MQHFCCSGMQFCCIFKRKRAHSSRARPLHQSKIPNCYFCQTFMSLWVEKKLVRILKQNETPPVGIAVHSSLRLLDDVLLYFAKVANIPTTRLSISYRLLQNHSTLETRRVSDRQRIAQPCAVTLGKCCQGAGQNLPTAVAKQETAELPPTHPPFVVTNGPKTTNVPQHAQRASRQRAPRQRSGGFVIHRQKRFDLQ